MSRFSAVGVLLICLVSACSDGANDQRTYVLTTGTTGGTFYPGGGCSFDFGFSKVRGRFFFNRNKFSWLDGKHQTTSGQSGAVWSDTRHLCSLGPTMGLGQ